MTMRVYEFSFHHYFYISFIVSEVRSNHSSSDIDMISDNTVSNIAEMCDIGMISKRRVFYLDRSSNMTIFTNNSGTSQIRVWSDRTIFSDVYISFNIGSRFEYSSFF